jgi:hypothetical protein
MDSECEGELMAISYPPVLINEYLAEKITERIPDRFAGAFRFFPTLPTDINTLTENFPAASNDVFAVYDRMFRFRRKQFPHVKNEQLLYYFYKMNSDPEALIETVQIVADLLDRGDESAQELNSWVSSKIKEQGSSSLITFGTGNLAREFKPVFFHDLEIWQLEETRDIIDFGTARTYAGNKLIVDYKYHTQNYD